jgi:hypothetical protein
VKLAHPHRYALDDRDGVSIIAPHLTNNCSLNLHPNGILICGVIRGSGAGNKCEAKATEGRPNHTRSSRSSTFGCDTNVSQCRRSSW